MAPKVLTGKPLTPEDEKDLSLMRQYRFSDRSKYGALVQKLIARGVIREVKWEELGVKDP